MTDNFYFNTRRETFIVTDDGYLYSVSNDAYYYVQGIPSLLFWSKNKASGKPWFESRRNPDGTLTVLLKNNGNASNGYISFCVMSSQSGNGNSGSGLHIYAIPQPGFYSSYGCSDLELRIDPAT